MRISLRLCGITTQTHRYNKGLDLISRIHVESSSTSRYALESKINTNDVEMIRASGGLLHYLSTTQASDQLIPRGGSSSDVVLQVTVNRVSQYVLSEYLYVS